MEGGKAVLLAVRDGCLVDACGDYGKRFGEGGGRGGEGGWVVYEDALVQWLRQCQVLVSEALDVSRARKLLGGGRRGGGGGGGGGGVGGSSLRRGAQERDEEEPGEGEEEEEGFYECGLEGCHKAFVHSHVGMEGVELPKEFGEEGR